ncbi:hypothetical protein DAPPPG734_25670 (plasmid) [Pantoea agglomerans]|uniref:Uncharacterized protein n=1 Tax=Enterobacter agglomerans TaxID=549 RepID=A0AAN2FI45_ENTAG|nr:hypothetical protein DAPPPG734_25670 [Pantoea agglomerans]
MTKIDYIQLCVPENIHIMDICEQWQLKFRTLGLDITHDRLVRALRALLTDEGYPFCRLCVGWQYAHRSGTHWR